ncbi:MAG: hypothetical protein PVH61_31345 [Candidatus Aminicenantes bacterium]|jgi:hypothetical protein
MIEDPIVTEVRKIRENLEAKFDFEPKAIFNDIRKRQATLGSRLIRRKKKFSAQQTPGSGRKSALLHPGR